MANGMNGVGCGGIGRDAAFVVPAKVIVITVVAPVCPGVTIGGLKVAVAPAGNPEADITTWLVKDVPTGGTLIVMLSELPGVAENGVGGAVTLNCWATVRVTTAEVDSPKVELPE